MHSANPISRPTSFTSTTLPVEGKDHDTAILIISGLGLSALAAAIYALAAAFGIDQETIRMLTFHS